MRRGFVDLTTCIAWRAFPTERCTAGIDPHTATGLHAHHHSPKPDGVVDVCLACAHPAKFPEAVEAACGVSPSLPHHLARRMEEPEREHLVPADLGQAMALIRSLVA